jgi:hypothetical protein
VRPLSVELLRSSLRSGSLLVKETGHKLSLLFYQGGNHSPERAKGSPEATQPISGRVGHQNQAELPSLSATLLPTPPHSLQRYHHLALLCEATVGLSPMHYSAPKSKPALITLATGLGTCSAHSHLPPR